jgi:hypothetical protein
MLSRDETLQRLQYLLYRLSNLGNSPGSSHMRTRNTRHDFLLPSKAKHAHYALCGIVNSRSTANSLEEINNEMLVCRAGSELVPVFREPIVVELKKEKQSLIRVATTPHLPHAAHDAHLKGGGKTINQTTTCQNKYYLHLSLFPKPTYQHRRSLAFFYKSRRSWPGGKSRPGRTPLHP